MPAKKLKQFLDANNVKYVSIKHSPAFTAQEVAHSAHIPGRDLAKTVIVKIGDQLAMAVLPAKYLVDLDLIRETTGSDNVELASEKEFKNVFPDCEIGAMPPFGNLYDMPVYVAEALRKEKEIAFNAGSHSELIKLAYEDFERLVKPIIIRLSLV
ncbi:MAG: aminoacyl-tRNA deacylase [Ignavibacteriales bacterium]